MFRRSMFVVALALIMLLLAACGGTAPTEEPTVGLPNPASAFCEENGGTLELRTAEDGGEFGVCVFEDGSECEEWAFFREECAPGDNASLVGMPNPASVFCDENGGTLEIRTSSAGEYGVCMFEDGSECEEWAYFREECAPGDFDTAPEPAVEP